MSKKVKDIIERTFWTGVEAGVAYASTRVADIPQTYTVPIAMGLAWLKGYVATKLGTNKDSAALGNGL